MPYPPPSPPLGGALGSPIASSALRARSGTSSSGKRGGGRVAGIAGPGARGGEPPELSPSLDRVSLPGEGEPGGVGRRKAAADPSMAGNVGGAAERGGMPPARLGPTDAAVPRQGKGRNGMRGQRLLPGLQAAAAGGSVWGGVELWGEVKQSERTGGRAGGARGGREGGAPFLARLPGTPASLSSGLRRCGEERGLQRGSRGAPPPHGGAVPSQPSGQAVPGHTASATERSHLPPAYASCERVLLSSLALGLSFLR